MSSSAEHIPLATSSRPAAYYDEPDFSESQTLLSDLTLKDEPLTPLLESGGAPSRGRTTSRVATRRYRRYLLFGLGGLVTSALVIALVTGWWYRGAPRSSSRRQKVTMDHIWNGTFAAQRGGVRWIAEAGDGVYVVDANGAINLHDLSSNTSSILALEADITDPQTAEALPFGEWSLAPQTASSLLLKAHSRKQWRHSSIGQYYVHHIQSKQTWALFHYAEGVLGDEQYAEWLPNGEGVITVLGGNLYVSWTDDPADAIAITASSTGNSSATTIFNGVPDWVYEEEVFGSPKAFWVSPLATGPSSGVHLLAYLTLNSTLVQTYSFPLYNPGSSANEVESYMYPHDVKIPYPKPGTPNPEVQVRVVRLEKGKALSKPLLLHWPGQLPADDAIIQEVAWVSSTLLILKEVGRNAEYGKVVLFDFGDSRIFLDGLDSIEGKVIRTLGLDGEEGDDGWIECNQNVYPLPEWNDVGGYLDIIPNSLGFTHLALFSPPSSSTPIFLTSGAWEVDASAGILGVDIERKKVYLRAGKPSTERRVIVVSLEGPQESGNEVQVQLSPVDGQVVAFQDQKSSEGEEGSWDATFSGAAGYFLLTYDGPNVPWQAVGKVVGDEGSFQTLQVLESNTNLNKTLEQFEFGRVTYEEVEVEKGVFINVKETRPPHFDDSGRTKYPVLFQVYGGPGSQMVTKSYSTHFKEYLTSGLGYIVVIADGRGTGWKGRELRNPVKNNLGWYETIDQIAVAKIWKDRNYVDPTKIGIWGWSYGGFMAAKVAEKDAGVHTLAMSVAPVTSWRLYDSIYTERYLGLPSNNPLGYLNASIQSVEGFGNIDYLLAHGSGDDNVHFANSARLVDMLTTEQIRGWRFRMFTDSDHSINTRGANREVYQFLADFLEEKWGVGGTRDGVRRITAG